MRRVFDRYCAIGKKRWFDMWKDLAIDYRHKDRRLSQAELHVRKFQKHVFWRKWKKFTS